MAFLEPVTLQGGHARLEPLSHDHIDGLVDAVRDGELWKLWYTFIPTAENMKTEIDRRLGLFAAGAMLPFTVLDADGKVAGMTTYMNVDAANRRVEIGSTWYAKRVQRSALNTQCKLLLLTHLYWFFRNIIMAILPLLKMRLTFYITSGAISRWVLCPMVV